MKIKCQYCDNMFDDVNATCPHCGAPNAGVVRRSGKQPITIEELKDWYASKGLPPSSVTRFFIGEDYKGKRAFGIYKDEEGNFVVYKNKDDGTRAVRYRGTDEAYAVNELYQRLKQEIIQQKGNNVSKSKSAPQSNSAGTSTGKKSGCLLGKLGCLGNILAAVFGIPLLIAVIWGTGVTLFSPTEGYYSYGDDIYYRFENPESSIELDWFIFDKAEQDWDDVDKVPGGMRIRPFSNKYIVSEQYSPSLGVSDFLQDDAYDRKMLEYYDSQSNHEVSTGYYQYNGSNYYHVNNSYDSGWYSFNTSTNDWDYEPYENVPDVLTHQHTATDFFFTPVWDSSTQITDFLVSAAYADYLEESDYSSSSSSSSSWDDDDDYDYSWSSSDSWDSGSSDWDSDW